MITIRQIMIRSTKNNLPHEPTTTIQSRGLGDTVARVTQAVGIKPCGGCQKRQELLNKMVPYK